ncbi:MAG: MBL fold metallo-hydrolase [Butyricicoccus sp.]|nr:MBL fold metallo-hydrolase [Butyricicoccus pullicaecorum]
MKILQMCVGMFATNCYIVFDEDTKEGAVIDPGANAEGILQAAEQAQVKLTWVLLTHGHFDHILAVRDIQKATGAKLAIHKDELWLLKKEILEGSIQTFGLSRRDDYEELTPDLLAEEGTEIAIGNLTATYLHTPGHTPGSSCIRVGDVLFTGDTLFRHECGRCDLEGGDFGKMLKSLKRLSEIRENLHVLPGHEGASTLDEERRMNPYIRQAVGK